MDYNQRIPCRLMSDMCFCRREYNKETINYVTISINVMPESLLENVCYYVICVGYQGKICKDFFMLQKGDNFAFCGQLQVDL